MIVDKRLGNTPRWFLTEPKDFHMRVPDTLRNSVIFLRCDKSVGGLTPGQVVPQMLGTAFLVEVAGHITGVRYTYLVTAKHLFQKTGTAPIFAEVNTSSDGRKSLPIGTKRNWITHPTDSSIDVAVLPWSLPADEHQHECLPVSMFLPDALLKGIHPHGPESVGTGDEFFIVGMFSPAGPKASNVPMVRTGTIAMLSSEPIQVELERGSVTEIEGYLVEVHSLTGMSGSPAFVRSMVPGGMGSLYLLGMMQGHWPIKASQIGEMELEEPNRLTEPTLHTGIGVVVPAKKILDVLNLQALRDQRAQGDEAVLRRNLPVLDIATE